MMTADSDIADAARATGAAAGGHAGVASRGPAPAHAAAVAGHDLARALPGRSRPCLAARTDRRIRAGGGRREARRQPAILIPNLEPAPDPKPAPPCMTPISCSTSCAWAPLVPARPRSTARPRTCSWRWARRKKPTPPATWTAPMSRATRAASADRGLWRRGIPFRRADRADDAVRGQLQRPARRARRRTAETRRSRPAARGHVAGAVRGGAAALGIGIRSIRPYSPPYAFVALTEGGVEVGFEHDDPDAGSEPVLRWFCWTHPKPKERVIVAVGNRLRPIATMPPAGMTLP